MHIFLYFLVVVALLGSQVVHIHLVVTCNKVVLLRQWVFCQTLYVMGFQVPFVLVSCLIVVSHHVIIVVHWQHQGILCVALTVDFIGPLLQINLLLIIVIVNPLLDVFGVLLLVANHLFDLLIHLLQCVH